MNRAFYCKIFPIFPCFILLPQGPIGRLLPAVLAARAHPGVASATPRLCVLAPAPLSRRPLGVASAALSGMHFLIDFILFGSGKAMPCITFPSLFITKTKLFEVSRR